MLKIENLHKKFGATEVLHGVNLEVCAREICGFIGQNGAGKTTTLRCSVGILEFEEGHITIDGIDIRKDPLAAKRILAYLPDNPDLYDNLSCMQYLHFIADLFQVDESVRTQRIEELGKELEIFDRLGDAIKTLSHGMKQKIAVISAFLHDPKLLVLDEPFVGLDPQSTFILKQKMHALCDRGGSVFFSSHVLEVVENLCDHLVIIKSGVVIKDGATDSILTDGKNLEEIFLHLEAEQ